MTRSSARQRQDRLWRALSSVSSEIPRQGLVVRIDVLGGERLSDEFRHEAQLVTSVGAAIARQADVDQATAPLALVDPCFLPVLSQCVDLVDAELLDAPPADLETRLAEIHRVLAASGRAYLTGRSRSAALELADLAARASFADGFGWADGGPRARSRVRMAAVHRHVQAWVGFEYTLGRGISAPRPSFIGRWLGRLRRERELVCWRTRPGTEDWKLPPSDEPMVFGRFHFPASAPTA